MLQNVERTCTCKAYQVTVFPHETIISSKTLPLVNYNLVATSVNLVPRVLSPLRESNQPGYFLKVEKGPWERGCTSVSLLVTRDARMNVRSQR